MVAKTILRTILFADLLDRPLALLEIARLIPGVPVREIDQMLTTELVDRIAAERGFFVLRGREDLMKIRKSREVPGDRKLQTARHVIRLFRHIPGVRAIAVCNSASWRGGSDDSDIDFFIMTRPRFLWIVRLFAVCATELFFSRPRPDATRDALCLSFYATTDFADLHEIAIGAPDRYLDFWRAHLLPFYDPDGLLKRFTTKELSPRWEISRSVLQPLFEFFAFWVEPIARALEMRLFPRAIKDLANRDTRVVVNDRMLKLYTTDRREEIQARFNKLLPLTEGE